MLVADPEWWRTWFGPGYVALYDAELAQRTPAEIDHLEQLLELRRPARILDLPCGQGRHAIELARRGHLVTGVDLSTYLLGIAEKRARVAGVDVRFVVGDMREPLAGESFDLVVNLFTSLGYFADEADDRKVVEAAAGMLEPGGRYLVEVVNGDRILANFQQREWFTVGQTTVLERRTIDRASRRMTTERTIVRDGEEEVNVHVVRLYGPVELRALLLQAGLPAIQLYGDWDGSPASADARRVLAIASKGT